MTEFGDTYTLDSQEAEESLSRLSAGARDVGQAFEESGRQATSASRSYAAAGDAGGRDEERAVVRGGGLARGGWRNLALGAALGRSPRTLAMQAARMRGAVAPAGGAVASALVTSYLAGRIADSGLIGAASETDLLRRARRAQIEQEGQQDWLVRAAKTVGLGGAAKAGLALRSRRLIDQETREQSIAALAEGMNRDREAKREQRELQRELLRASRATTARATRQTFSGPGASLGY